MKIFDHLPKEIQQLLVQLEERDKEERKNAVETKKRLRQIPRETGEFLFNFISSLVQNTNDWTGLEIGGSGGYSTIWQGLALKSAKKGSLKSLEIDEKKVELANKNLSAVGLTDYVQLIHTDAKKFVNETKIKFSYVFLDAEKEDYLYYFKQLEHKVYPGCIWIADNLISHADDMKEFVNYLDENKHVRYTILSIGKGLAFIEVI